VKIKVNLMLARLSTEQLIVTALSIVSKMKENNNFINPNPPLSSIINAVNELQTSYENALGGGPAQTEVMHQKRIALELQLTSLGHYVEDTVNNSGNTTIAKEGFILSAGMGVKHNGHRQKQVFSAIRGMAQGSVVLLAPHVIRAYHEWQYTTDLANPESWIAVTPTIRANVTIIGLERLKIYHFRHRSLTAHGYSEWENPIELLVI